MGKAYISAQKWHEMLAAMRKAGKGTPPIENVRTECWSITISLKEGSGNTLESVQKLMEKLAAENKGFSAAFSEEEGKQKDETTGQGYRHAQCCVHLKTTGRRMLELFTGTKGHIEPARNTSALMQYIQKKDTHISGPYTYGKWEELKAKIAQQGKRSDLVQLDAAINSGMTYEQIATDPDLRHMTIRYEKYIRQQTTIWYRQHPMKRSPLQNGLFSVDYIFGSSGTGKTRTITNFYGEQHVFIVEKDMLGTPFPFEGYQGQPVILLDEFESSVPFKKLLQWLEDYNHIVNIKGTSTPARWKKIVICSSIPVTEQYKGKLAKGDGSIHQFWRRLMYGRIIMQTQQHAGYPYETVEDAYMGKWNSEAYPYSKSIEEVTGYHQTAADESEALDLFMATDRTGKPLNATAYTEEESYTRRY